MALPLHPSTSESLWQSIFGKVSEASLQALKFYGDKQHSDAHAQCIKCQTLLQIASLNDFQAYSKDAKIRKYIANVSTIVQLIMEDTDQNNHIQGTSVNPTTLTNNGVDKKSESNTSIPYEFIQGMLFENIIGCNQAKRSLHENVILPLTMANELRASVFAGIRGGTGNVLLYGPPGMGKTILVDAAAGEAEAALISVRPSDILSKYQGESEKYLRDVFEQARALPRAIVFFDEFDSIGISRGGNDEGAQSRRLLSELLIQLTKHKTHSHAGKPISSNDSERGDSHIKNEHIVPCSAANSDNTDCRMVVIAATNRLFDLDEAVLRRFESKICVDAPDSTARAELILHFLRGIDHRLDHEDAADLANLTDGWSCSHIETLCREAAMAPVRRINGLNGPQYVTLSASYSHQAVSPSPSESHLDDKSFVSPLDINEEAGAALGRSQTATSVLGKRGPNTTADNTCINGAQKHTVLHEEREETEYGHRDPIVSPVTYSDFIEAHSSVTIGMGPAVMPDVDGLPQLGPGVDNQVEI